MPRLLGDIPWIRKLFGKGVNSDIAPEFLPEALGRDAQNMRPSGVAGDSGALESIGGEASLFTPEPDEAAAALSYVCIGVVNVSGHEVSFWASKNPGEPVRIKIDGTTMVESLDIPYRWDRPLQFGGLDTVEGGRVYPTDHENDMFFWDIPAIIAAYLAGENTYTTGLNIALVTYPTPSPAEWLEHIGTTIGQGLPVGQYSYQLRWGRGTGDRSNFGPPTPLITIPRSQAPIYTYSGQYPGGQTVGGVPLPNTSIPTSYGIRLKFQVDNILGYTFVEIVRTRYNDGQGLNGPGVTEVIGRIDVEPGQFNYIIFEDPQDANFLELIPLDEAQQEQVNFTAPKTVEHVDKRLVIANFRLRDRIANLAFRLLDGLKVFPLTQRVFTRYNGQEYNDGHSDPVNNTYTKSAQHNERYGLGIEIWDDRSSRSPVFPMEDNFLFPDKRDRKQNGPLTYSTDPIYAANNECQDPGDGSFDPVSPTFDCIVQGSTPKVDDSYTNVLEGSNYNPFSPVNPADPNFVRYRQKPVISRVITQDGIVYPDAGNIFAPQYHTLGVGIPGVLNLPPWAKIIGLMRTDRANRVIVEGSASYDLEEGPGGVYEYNPSGSASTITRTKSTNTLRCFFPDIDAAVLGQSFSDDITNNPQNYRVRLTPYGFYGEPYAYRTNISATRTGLIIDGDPFIINMIPASLVGISVGDGVSGTGIQPGTVVVALVPPDGVVLSLPVTTTGTYGFQFSNATYAQDVITYATMQFEPGSGVAGNVNIGDAPGAQGFQPTFSAPASPTNYIGPGAWRHNPIQNVTDTNDPNYSVFLDPNNTSEGAIELSIEAFTPIVEGRNTIYRIRIPDQIYTRSGQTAEPAFNDPNTRRFHEGLYSIQIIRSDATVPDLNIQQYKTTGNYIDVARCIGFGQAVTPPAFYDLELFHAHRDSCVGYLQTDFRYCYIQQPGLPEQRYVCMTNNVVVLSQFATISVDLATQGFWIAPDGLEVHGVYQAITDIASGPHPIHYLRFGAYVNLPVPPVGSRIIVKYDNSAVWRCTGFDCSIGPTIWAPYDRSFNAANGLSNGTGNMQVFNGAPLPYNGGGRASQYVLPRDGDPISPTIEPVGFNRIVSHRQWVVWSELVTRVQQRMNGGVTTTNGEQFQFPQTHYVIRPSAYYNYANGEDNGFWAQYDDDYPDEGILNYPLGGFHIRRTYNLDYAKQPIVTGLGLPQNGQYPKILYPYTYLASLPLDPQAVDAPGLGTFLWDNQFTVSQENGEIKKILSLNGQLFGGCETGLHRVPYNKQMLTDADANTIGTQSIGTFWPREEIWLARGSKGMPDQTWRNATKVNSEGIDTMVWTDRVSFYELRGGQIVDIARGKYLSVLQPVISTMLGDYGQGYSAMYNFKQGEVWISIPVNEILPNHRAGSRLFVYSCVNREWIGVFTYNYDQFLSRETQLIGYKALSANNLDMGDTLNPGTPIPIPCSATTAYFTPVGAYKEMMRWRVVGVVPDEVEVYDHDGNLRCRMSQAENGSPLWVKLYDSYEGWVSRVLASVDSQRPLPQDVGFFMKIKWNSLGRKTISAADAQTKQIR